MTWVARCEACGADLMCHALWLNHTIGECPEIAQARQTLAALQAEDAAWRPRRTVQRRMPFFTWREH